MYIYISANTCFTTNFTQLSNMDQISNTKQPKLEIKKKIYTDQQTFVSC